MKSIDKFKKTNGGNAKNKQRKYDTFHRGKCVKKIHLVQFFTKLK
jgi:hypothetical protein